MEHIKLSLVDGTTTSCFFEYQKKKSVPNETTYLGVLFASYEFLSQSL